MARDVLFDESQEELAKLEAAGEEFEEVKPLAEELIDTLIDLLFFADFTLPKPQNTKSKVSYAIWQSGVGCNTSVATSKEFENNRTEVLRLLLTLTSQSMYMPANLLPVQGVKAISYIVSCPDKQVVLSVLCSLLNTVRSSGSRDWINANIGTDSQIQPGDMAGTLQRAGFQRSEADIGDICSAGTIGSLMLNHIFPNFNSSCLLSSSTPSLNQILHIQRRVSLCEFGPMGHSD